MDVDTTVLFALAVVGLILGVIVLIQTKFLSLVAAATTVLALALVLNWWPD